MGIYGPYMAIYGPYMLIYGPYMAMYRSYMGHIVLPWIVNIAPPNTSSHPWVLSSTQPQAAVLTATLG